jgi:Cell division septal protein
MTTTDLPPTTDGVLDLTRDDPNAPAIGGVDPRMRDRWVEARRAEGRRRLRIAIAVIGIASLVGIAYLVAHSPLFGADTIRVRGAGQTPPDAVRAAARIADGSPVLFLDAGAIEKRVEAVPGIDRATVTTELPSTVVITVTERQPVAWMRATGTAPIALVDGTGRVVARLSAIPASLPKVVGVGSVAPLGRSVGDPAPFRGLTSLPVALRLRTLRFITRHGQGILVIQGTPPVVHRIRFGPLVDMRQKGAAAIAVLDDLAARGQEVQILDVTVPVAPVTR